MKKLLMTLVLTLSTVLGLNAKCDWSTLKLQQWDYTEYNYYKWYVSGKVLDDTCVNYMFMVYDFQTKRIDTLNSLNGISEVRFYKNGKYKMYLKVWNKCLKCDTALYREITVTNIINFSSCKFPYSLRNTGKCNDSIIGEMTLGPWIKGDTCWEWYSWIWNGPLLDSISQRDWDSISDYELWGYYDFNKNDLKWKKGPANDARIVKYKFPKDGHYLIATQWYNSCLDQDTVFFTRITIKCGVTSGIKMFTRPEPKLIGMYDMMGRPVNVARENEITIFRYSDGTSRKIFKK